MKTKALLLSALILAPSAGAAAVQAAPTQDFRVQTNKTLAAPAQDFRVSYAKAAPGVTSAIFAKSNLPQALSDEELDGVTGEGVVTGVVGGLIGALGGALWYGFDVATGGGPGTARGAVSAVVGGAVTGAAGAVLFPLP